MKSATLAVAALLVASVSAQNVVDEKRLFYSEPIQATFWKAGSTHTVSWTNKCDKVNAGRGPLNIVLYHSTGPENKTQILVPNIDAIGTLDCLNSNKATVVLPANLTTGAYSIHVDTEPFQSYSGSFTILGIDPPKASDPAPTSAPTTAAPAPVESTTPQNQEKPDSSAGSLKIATSLVAALALAVGTLMA
ncbi:hypothetical protein BGW41_000967 [Actinomortierella wolfii]|nr:hypothetical protein BGW41_000967 [Actinomortierella wolfii]